MYYTYELADPRCGTVFYIGKGKGSRRFHHTKEAKAGVHSRKCERIRAILEEGLEPLARIVAHYRDEAEAYEAERVLIEEIGLANLTNVAPGGGGRYVKPIKPVVPFKWDVASLKKLGSNVARALQVLALRQRFMFGHMDVTEIVREMISRIVADVGPQAFADTIRPYGIEVKYGDA